MYRYVSVLVLALGVVAGAQAADPVVVAKPVPYAADSDIASNIKEECKLTTELPDFVAEFAQQHGVTVTFANAVTAQTPGRVLEMQITDAVSQGNAWMGHHKSTTVAGKLYQDGKLVGSFLGKRNSMGGMFAGYKGSCSVLGRTVKALGEDIGAWLAAPTMDARLGDLQ